MSKFLHSWIVLAVIGLVAAVNLSCADHARIATATPSAGTLAPAPTTAPTASDVPTTQPDPIIARIRDEGMNRSKVMDTLSQLCDVIGPRLTGSPSCKRASDWTRQTLESWGLTNAHLEAWGPFGRGWAVKRFSLQVTEPYTIVLNGYPKAWSPGSDAPLEAPVVLVDATKESELEKFKGKLSGAIVLVGAPRDVEARFQPLASRLQDNDLDRLATAQTGSNAMLGQPRAETAAERRAQFAASGAQGEALLNRRNRRDRENDSAGASTTQPTSRPSRFGGRRRFDPFAAKALAFAADQGASLVLTPSTTGDGGTFFVTSASIPGEQPFGGGPTTGPTSAPTTGPTTRPRVWSIDAPHIPPQVTLAVEDYNRLARMLQRGQKLKMTADLDVEFYEQDQFSYNTIAEIPGTDLKDQIVMVGAHLDSWHSGTGATDNAVGSAAAMEAMRIIQALNLHPRRTIRVALWTGEEQGLLGSAAYVKKHFGHDPEASARRERERARRAAMNIDDPNAPEGGDNNPATQPATRPARNIIKEADYENLSVYFNLDNGTGKIRGIYAQSNDAAVPIFKEWIAYFRDIGATTVSLSNTGSTDHASFDQINLPGFQFIQDPIEYNSRTHHSNEDVYDRIQADDMKQASTIMAAFVWKAANMDERFPRKPVDAPDRR
jgi:hypothetical protein